MSIRIKLSKTESEEKINEFFLNLKNKSPKDVKKIKKLAMRYNIHLKDKRKKFCKKCFTPYNNSKIRIKNKTKTIKCNKCGYVNKWKIK